jgi:hypothetical protein
MSPAGPTIEVVRDADERTQGAVCVAVDESGRTVGMGSVRKEIPPPLGRPVWVYESDLVENSEDLGQRMFMAAFDRSGKFNSDGDGPLGVCRLVTDDVETAKRPRPSGPEVDLRGIPRRRLPGADPVVLGRCGRAGASELADPRPVVGD